ncbi:acyl-CoA dehydrogenase family protein [Streptosporangium sp. NPDC000563]|uniref:acyl-CoA dehydrogenase family protein n=1 Tax=unclassified Streptosporangium TaxID=2632669 RepID=UPI00331C4CB0
MSDQTENPPTGEAAFQDAVRAFLDAHAKPLPEAQEGWGVGSDELSSGAEPTREEELRMVEAATAFRRELFDAGFGWLTGPAEYGGGGREARFQELFDEVAADYELPSEACFVVGHHIVAPTLLAWGTPEVKERYLRALYRADLLACQLFSEPEAGSDLAGVRSRGVRDGDGWRVSGQKVWTSGAHYSDIGEMLVRTDPEASKHGGLTMLMIDMHDPGVEIRPLRQMTGGEAFNEVFVDDVFVPDSHVLGKPGDGWKVAMTTLGNERASMGYRTSPPASDPVERLLGLIRHFGLEGDTGIRSEFARIAIRRDIIRWTAARAAARAAGGEPGAEASIIKLMDSENVRAIGALAGRVLGARMTADTGEWGTYVWAELMLSAPSLRLAGGTDEIMRNIMAERILGLPREPAPNR